MIKGAEKHKGEDKKKRVWSGFNIKRIL